MNDWRLSGNHDYLKGKSFKRVSFPFYSMSDHEHCELCWGKFSNFQEDLHVGYCHIERNQWICETCFEDFKSMFDWTCEENYL